MDENGSIRSTRNIRVGAPRTRAGHSLCAALAPHRMIFAKNLAVLFRASPRREIMRQAGSTLVAFGAKRIAPFKGVPLRKAQSEIPSSNSPVQTRVIRVEHSRSSRISLQISMLHFCNAATVRHVDQPFVLFEVKSIAKSVCYTGDHQARMLDPASAQKNAISGRQRVAIESALAVTEYALTDVRI